MIIITQLSQNFKTLNFLIQLSNELSEYDGFYFVGGKFKDDSKRVIDIACVETLYQRVIRFLKIYNLTQFGL